MILSALIIFIFLPSCGNKRIVTKQAPGYLSNIETRPHTSRPGHRIANRTETQTDSYSSTPNLQHKEEEPIRIQDVSIQEHRSIGDQLVATLKLIVNGEETEIDLFGIIAPDGTADLRPIGLSNLVHGVAICIDREFCHQIVLDIYYRTINGTIKRYQVQSVTPEVQVEVEVIEDSNIQEDSPLDNSENTNDQEEPSPPTDSSQAEDLPTTETPEGKSPINVNVLPEIPEGDMEEPQSTIVTRPPFDLEAIHNLPIPTIPIIRLQQLKTTNIRERLEEGEDVSSFQTHPPTPTVPESDESETQNDDDDFVPAIDPEIEVKEAMGIAAPSQFLDDYLNQSGSIEDAIRRQAINRRSSGILREGELLVREIHGIKWLQHGEDHLKWVTSMTNHFIRIIGSTFQRQHPEHFVIINRSSRQHGGHLEPHRTHQNGLDLDIAYPHAEPSRQRFWSVYDGRRQFVMTERDAEITMDLLKTMSATNVINKYHVDQSVKDYLTHIAETTGKLKEQCPILTQLCHASGHQNHIHVQLKCTQFNQGCHDSVDPPYSTCPTPVQCQGI